MPYKKYSTYLKDLYGEKVYKIPINVPGTCPNRDGAIGTGGCVFCSEVGAGFEAQSNEMGISEQLQKNMDYIGPKYNAKKFIAYFQNFTGTYLPLDTFKLNLEQVCMENVVGISVSTRPDCIGDAYLEALKSYQQQGYAIEIELGLQSININTLRIINRGHGLAEFVDAVLRIKRFGYSVCVHLIGNLPWDTEFDFYEAAKLLSVLDVDAVKVHSLYILENTPLGQWYEYEFFQMLPPEAYIERVIHFLRVLKPSIAIQRLFARAPEGSTLFCNWDMSWRKLLDELEEKMIANGYRQGDLYNSCSCKEVPSESHQRMESDVDSL